MPVDKQHYKRKYLLRKVEERESEELIKDATSKLIGSEEDTSPTLPDVRRPD